MSTDNSKELDTYYKEWIDSIRTLQENEVISKKFHYFFQVAETYFKMKHTDNEPPKFIIIGTSFPEELIYAVGETPFWVLGGSLGTADAADSMLPRDTDAVTYSILGYLKSKNFHLLDKATVIVPVTCDSMRKLPSILENDANVITVDFPPSKTSLDSREKWISQMRRIVDQLEKITRKKVTKYNFQNALYLVNRARAQMRKFEYLSRKKNTGVSGALRLFVLNTYYFSRNIEEWSNHLQAINKELEKQSSQQDSQKRRPKVLLMGSPVYFPNFKIPFLLQDIGLDISTTVNVMTQKIFSNSMPGKGKLDFSNYFNAAEWKFYETDCSSSYIDNITLLNNIKAIVKQSPFEGVIYHILKGQIEYDFELSRYEEFFNGLNIPVFRLETDYKYQDIEQLKIRTEAFKEMLIQNIYRKGNQSL